MKETRFKDTEIGKIPEDWEVNTIGEISDFYNGVAHESIVDDNGKWILVNSKFISSESDVVKHVSFCLHPCYINNILMVMSDVPNGKAIAKCFFVEKNNTYSLNQRICQFVINNGVPRFIFYALNRNPYYLSFDDGVKQTNLTKREVLSCPLRFPPHSEQSRIASALTSIDNLISSLDKLIEKKKNIKQGTMQQLLTGKKRLKGFTEPWVEKRMWEVTIWDKKFNGVSSFMQKDSIKYPYVLANVFEELETHGGDVLLLSTGNYVGWTTVEKAGKHLCEGEVVAIPWGGVANVKYAKGKFVTADNRIATSSDLNVLDNKYLYYQMLFRSDEINSFYRGASIKHPSMLDVLTMILQIPSIEEQKAIASVLTSMDNEISALESKKAKYESMKQGMMQQLLTGKIRLI